MHENEEEGDGNGDETKNRGQPESQAVKRVIMPYGHFSNRFVLECGVALGPAHLVKRKEAVVVYCERIRIV